MVGDRGHYILTYSEEEINMFIVNLTYIKPLSEVEKYLAEHIEYLEKYYAAGKFICSGRKNPRNGGIILCQAKDAAELQAIIREDPFHREQIADYEILDFFPSKCAAGFEALAR